MINTNMIISCSAPTPIAETNIAETDLTANKFKVNGLDIASYFYKKNNNLNSNIFYDKFTIDYSAKSIDIENTKTPSTKESVKSVEYTRKYTMTEQGLEIKHEITKVVSASDPDIEFADFICTTIEIKTELIKTEELKKTDTIGLNLTIKATAAFLLTTKDSISKFTAAGISFLVTPADLVVLDKEVKGANLIIDGITGFDTEFKGNEEEKNKKYADLNNAIDNNKITVIADTTPTLKDGKTLTKVDKFDSKIGIAIKLKDGKYVTDISQICEILKLDPKRIGWSILKHFMVWGGTLFVVLLITLGILYAMKKGPFAPKDSNEEVTNAVVAAKDAVTTNVLAPAKEVATEISAAAAA